MSEEFYTNEEGNLFIQDSRENPFAWLTCTGVGTITIPRGDRTAVYCPSPGMSGEWEIAGFIKGDPGAGTYSLTKPLAMVYNYLLELKCQFAARINWVCAGLREDPRNYEIAMVIPDSEASSSGIDNPTRTPDGTAARVHTTMDVSFMKALMVYPLSIRRQTVTNTANANSVFFLPEMCESRCKDIRRLCTYGTIGLDNSPGYLYDTEVKVTTDGTAWAESAVDPFTWGGDVSKVLMFDIRDGYRIIAFREDPLVGAPAECAYSDDGGATWTNVALPGGNNLAVLGATIFGARMVAVGTDGYIWESTDLGETWTTLDAGAATANDLYDVVFHTTNLGYAVGASNTVVITEDGGDSWAALTGPDAGVTLMSVAVTDAGDVFVAGNAGILYRSADHGDTWANWRDLGGGTWTWVAFDPDAHYIGYAAWNSVAGMGYLYRSEDGGATWYRVANMPTNSGLNDGHICDQNNLFLVGAANSGTTFIAKVQPAAA